MLASDIVKRARSLSDTPNSQFISTDDEQNSLWEAWKDIYSKITDSSDDYFLTEYIFDPSVTAVKLGNNEWECTIPNTVYKIRFVNYMDTLSGWANMDRFNTSNRNNYAATPRYRWRGNKLWIVASSLPSQIRLEYYPAPVRPTVPEPDYYYCLSLAQYDKVNISSPNYFSVQNPNTQEQTDYLVYIYNGTTIKLQSYTLNSTSTLYTSTGLSNVAYNLGYIYFLKGGDIWRATTDYSSTIVPAAITSVGNITNFTISQNKIYFSDGTNTNYCNLDGTGTTLIYAYTTSGFNVIGSDYFYIKDSDGFIYKNTTSLAISAVKMSGDGTNYYYLDSASVLHKNDDVVMATNILYMGTPQNGFISTINDQLEISAISTIDDTDFDYPINEANEIMAYQSAIDYKRKQNGDIAPLSARLAEVWSRFLEVLKRDEGQPERRTREVPFYQY